VLERIGAREGLLRLGSGRGDGDTVRRKDDRQGARNSTRECGSTVITFFMHNIV
jgi:hypothetical protein